jgi:photosystem II stability/assembly factor-like uncharacterized protein
MIRHHHVAGLFFVALGTIAIFNLFLFSNTSAGFWVPQTNSGQRNWTDVAVSSDGTKLAATVSGGYIYTSTDSGATWTERTGAGSANWTRVVSSSDGTILLATIQNENPINISIDGGATWGILEDAGNRQWLSVAMTGDGTRMAAVERTAQGGYIYTSTSSGAIWTQQTVLDDRYWYEVIYSADGSKLLAIGEGVVFLSEDFGETWNEQILDPAYYDYQSYQGVISPDGTIIYLAGGLFMSTDGGDTWLANPNSPGTQEDTVQYLEMSSDGQEIFAASLDVIYISIDGGATWFTDTTFPNQAAQGLAVSSDGALAYLVRSSTYIQKALVTNVVPTLSITTPALDDLVSLWDPVIDWGTSLRCAYSYDNVTFTSTSCFDGSSVAPPLGGSAQTLYIRGVNLAGTSTASRAFRYPYEVSEWTTQLNSPDGNWYAVATSADGQKVVAAVKAGYVYTSTDSGATWTQQTGSGVKDWLKLASSADGTKLAAITTDSPGSIYTSSDSGVTWVERVSAGSYQWRDITSSADGVKLVASTNNNYVHTSIDGGTTWTQQLASPADLNSITSSSDGVKLAGISQGSRVFTSTDSGATWTERDLTTVAVDIASSADGLKLVVVTSTQYAHTSTDGGATWTQRTSIGNGELTGVVSSNDGLRLAAIDRTLSKIRTSDNGGVTWVIQDSTPTLINSVWTDIASSADGAVIHIVDAVPPGDGE